MVKNYNTVDLDSNFWIEFFLYALKMKIIYEIKIKVNFLL